MTTLITLVLETTKNNFTSDCVDYADFRDYIKSNFTNFTTDCTDYSEFRNYIKNNFTTDYADYADFKDYLKKFTSYYCGKSQSTTCF